MTTLRHAMAVLLCLTIGVIFIPGCGDDGGGNGGCSANPAGPGCATPATITPNTDMVYIGQRVTFSANPATGVTWGGDAPSVATVDASTGAVTGVATGKVTIWAQNSAGRTTRLLSVIPSYNGEWTGSYSVNGCQATGDFAEIDFCEMFYAGEILNMGFGLTQSRDQVTGSFSLGDLTGALSASTVNGTDGSLPLTGSSTTADGLVIQVQNLRATSPSPGTMKGPFDQVWALPGAAGTGRLVCEIRDVTRTSGAPTVRYVAPGANAPALTLEQAIRAVRRR